MPKDIYIYSTMTEPVTYTKWEIGSGRVPVKVGEVRIQGGANKADKNLYTPYGAATKIDQEDLALLENNHVFKLHRDNGFIKVGQSKADPNKVAADLEGRDGSAPLVPQDYENVDEGDGARPVELQSDVKGGRKATKK